MAYGIYTQPIGPGPATPAPLFIDSNMTFPQTVASVSGWVRSTENDGSYNFSGWDGSGTGIALPTTSLLRVWWSGTSIIPSTSLINGWSFSNSYTLKMSWQGGSGANNAGFNIYKLWPQGNQSYGITFSNSANFFAISDSGVVGQCIYAYRGNVSDGQRVPDIAGFDMTKAIVFANWNDSGQTLSYDPPSRTFIVCRNASRDGNNRGGTIGGVSYAVYCSGASVPEHNGGLNIYSPDGQRCVFSTRNTPFILSGFVPMSGGNPGLSMPMVCLTRAVGVISTVSGGFVHQHDRATTMVNGTIGTGWGVENSTWTDRWEGLRLNITLNQVLPVLEGAYIFA